MTRYASTGRRRRALPPLGISDAYTENAVHVVRVYDTHPTWTGLVSVSQRSEGNYGQRRFVSGSMTWVCFDCREACASPGGTRKARPVSEMPPKLSVSRNQNTNSVKRGQEGVATASHEHPRVIA